MKTHRRAGVRAGILRAMIEVFSAAFRLLSAWRATNCAGCGTRAPEAVCPVCLSKAGGARVFQSLQSLGAVPPSPRLFLAPYALGGQPTALAQALLRFKYGGDRACGRGLTRLFSAAAATLPTGFDLIVPVPLHARRLRERGYNQAAWLGRGAAVRLGLSFDPAALLRVRYTPSQARLGARDRRALGNVFSAEPRRVSGHRVLLVDDVFTTGATATDAARALCCAGATTVGIAVLLAAVECS